VSAYRIAGWSVSGAEGWPAKVEAEEHALLPSAGNLETIGHNAQIADMIAAIREGRPPAVSGDEGRRSLEVCLAIYESARTGREVQLSGA